MTRQRHVRLGLVALKRFARHIGMYFGYYPLLAVVWLFSLPFVALGLALKWAGQPLTPREKCWVDGHKKDHDWGDTHEWHCTRCGTKNRVRVDLG